MTEITLMRVEDVEAVHAIEEACFATPWSLASFLYEVTENQCARYLVLREDGACVAYAGMWFVLDEAHITNIAVRADDIDNPVYQRIAEVYQSDEVRALFDTVYAGVYLPAWEAADETTEATDEATEAADEAADEAETEEPAAE